MRPVPSKSDNACRAGRLSSTSMPPPALDYRNHGPVHRPDTSPEALYRFAVVGSAVAAGGGLLIVLICAVTRFEATAIAGLIWVLVGGIITITAGLCGLVYAVLALSKGFEPPNTRRRAILAIASPIGTVAVAVLCMRVGALLLEWSGSSPLGYSAVTLTLINTTDTPIESITARGTSTANEELGPLGPSAKIEKLVHLKDGDGSVELTVRSGSETWEQSAIGYYTNGANDRPREIIRLAKPEPGTQPSPE